MNYASFAEHEEVYIINDKPVKVKVNFVNNKIFIDNDIYSLNEYEKFEGNMEAFTRSKLSK